MELWKAWFQCILELRVACSRRRTFIWMVVVLAGLSVRNDLAGVTSIVRVFGLKPSAYPRLLHLFHSKALNVGRLTTHWTLLVHQIFSPLRVNGRPVYLADGIKTSKEGRKMPAVKKLHQSSQNNTKPTYIMGHSLQAISVLVQNALGGVAAIPLTAQIHEGLIFWEEGSGTLPQKMADMGTGGVQSLEGSVIFVADAYYACKEMIRPLLEKGHDLVTRVRINAVAYFPASKPRRPRPGRPRIYGKKLKLKRLLEETTEFDTAPSPVYGEGNVEIAYRCLDLLWRPLGRLVRFVLVRHPYRGKIILMTTDVTMDPITVIALYGYRFKIELGFKQAIHVIGTYAYHFWMKGMKPISRKTGDQNLIDEPIEYWSKVIRKINAYHRYIQLGCIAQGLLQYLAITKSSVVWNHFRSWLRTMNPNRPPSELVVAQALRSTLKEFLATAAPNNELKNILKEFEDTQQVPILKKAA